MSCLPGELVIFGVSNILSDIFDCARALGFTVKKIVQNQPEVVRERTRTLAERIELLPSPPTLHILEEFVPSPSESYFWFDLAIEIYTRRRTEVHTWA